MKKFEFKEDAETLFEAYNIKNHEKAHDEFCDKQVEMVRMLVESPSDDINEVEIAKIVIEKFSDKEILMMSVKEIINVYENFMRREIIRQAKEASPIAQSLLKKLCSDDTSEE